MRQIKRALTFLATRIFTLSFVFALAVLAFYTAMNTANIWFLVDEGLEARARLVIQGTEATPLTSYFTDEFLAQDPVLSVVRSNTSPYKDYTVRSFTHKTQFRSIWSWPWESVARAEVIESVPRIDGTIDPEMREAALQAGGEDRLSPPAWEEAYYRVTLIRTGGRWKISSLQVLAQ